MILETLPDPVRDNFKRNLRYWFQRSQLTKTALGERVGVTGSAVKHWLDGKAAPELARLDVIARALGTNYLELVKDTSHTKEISVEARDLETILRELGEKMGFEIRSKWRS